MPKVCDPAVVERARVLVEGSARTLGDIAREVGVSLQSVRNWSDRYGWRRCPLAPRAVPKLPPEKEGPARRLYEGGTSVEDLGPLLSCHPSYVHKLAHQRGWTRRPAGAAAAEADDRPPSPAMQALAARLCAPDLSASDFIALSAEALQLLFVESLTNPDPDPVRRARTLDRIVRAIIALPEPPPAPPAPRRLSPEEEKAEIDELVRRLERFAQEEDEGGADGVYEAA